MGLARGSPRGAFTIGSKQETRERQAACHGGEEVALHRTGGSLPSDMTTWGIHNDQPGDRPGRGRAVRIGWDEMGDLSGIAPTRDAFKDALVDEDAATSDDAKIPAAPGPCTGSSTPWLKATSWFVPIDASRTLNIGTVSGPYEFHPESQGAPALASGDVDAYRRPAQRALRGGPERDRLCHHAVHDQDRRGRDRASAGGAAAERTRPTTRGPTSTRASPTPCWRTRTTTTPCSRRCGT